MKVFCQDCNFLNYSQGQNNPVMLEIDKPVTRRGQLHYVCPNGHYIFKLTVDTLGAEAMQALTEFGGAVAGAAIEAHNGR